MIFSSFTSSRGITLLEMLVVLILVSLISTLVLEGFSYIFRLRLSLFTQLDNVQHGTMQAYWFHQTTTGLTPDYLESEHQFEGNNKSFHGLTLSPLDAPAGVPMAFGWKLETQETPKGNMTKLYYQTGNGTLWEVLSWKGTQGQFSYQSPDGRWHTRWPPALKRHAHLPTMILFEGKRHQKTLQWIIKLTEYNYLRRDIRAEEW